MIAATFNGFTKTGEQNMPNAAATSISMIYIVGAVIFGLFQKYVKPWSGLQLAVGIAMMIAMLAMASPADLRRCQHLARRGLPLRLRRFRDVDVDPQA